MALVVLCAGLLFYGLGWLPMIGPDEPRYAEVAREMYASGDWITPQLGGLHWFEKPALTYWLSAVGYKLFGVSEFSARIGIALVAALSAWLLYFFGCRLRSASYGYLSASALLSSGLWLGFGRAATFDTPLAMTMELALLAFYLWEREQQNSSAEKQNNFWWYVCCFGLGLAVLAKGLVGIVLPAGIIGLYLLLTRGLISMLKRPVLLLVGAMIFLLTTATWYGPMFARHGREFWHEFFLAHHFQRYLTNKYQHPQPVWFFLAMALLGCLPWSFHLLGAGRDLIGRWRAFTNAEKITNDDRWQLYLWVWALLPVVFFSFSGSKLPGYILPVFPALALLIGGELEKLFAGKSSAQFTWLSALNGLLLTGVSALVWQHRKTAMEAREAVIVAISVALVAVAYLALLWSRKAIAATLFLPFGVMIIIVTSAHLLFPELGRQESMRELSRLAVQSAQPGERLAFYLNTEQSLNFYAPALPLRDEKAAMMTAMSVDEIVSEIKKQNASSLLIIALERWSGALTKNERFVTERLGGQERTNRHHDRLDSLVLLRVRLK